MGCSVREAQDRIDSREFAEWRAYWTEEPFAPDRNEHQLGMIAAMIANSLRKKGGRPFKASQFMPSLMNKVRQQSAGEIFHRFAAFAKLHNATRKKGDH